MKHTWKQVRPLLLRPPAPAQNAYINGLAQREKGSDTSAVDKSEVMDAHLPPERPLRQTLGHWRHRTTQKPPKSDPRLLKSSPQLEFGYRPLGHCPSARVTSPMLFRTHYQPAYGHFFDTELKAAVPAALLLGASRHSWEHRGQFPGRGCAVAIPAAGKKA